MLMFREVIWEKRIDTRWCYLRFRLFAILLLEGNSERLLNWHSAMVEPKATAWPRMRRAMGKLIDLTGQRFGRLVVLERAENQGKQTKWLCQCECGNITLVRASRLRGNMTQSCGCIQKEVTRDRSLKHGGSNSRLYHVWQDMRHRCESTKDREYERYGGRGIEVCNEWKDYSVFQTWALENGYDSAAKRGECTLDRIDVNGNYCPKNCRWVNMKKQSNNRRDNHIIEYNGESHTLSEWSEITGIKSSTLGRRINALGWSIEKALTTPKCKNQHG